MEGGKVNSADNNSMWTKYKIRMMFLTKLCASVPADPELMESWIKAKQPRVKPPGGKSIDEINAEVIATIAEQSEGEEETQYSMLVFQQQNDGLVVRAATVRAHMKDCARVLSAQWIGRIQGERAFSTRVINGAYPDEKQYWLPILRHNGELVKIHDGERDKPIHVRGPRGQTMNALKRYQWVEPARVDFMLKVLGKSVSQDDLGHLFNYGGVHGYGGERGDGEGKYLADIEKLKEE